MLSIIVAKAKNNTIGKDNKIVWNLPEDRKRFKNLTEGHVLIMGRKTFESLGKVLPNRKHIVMTENKSLNVDDSNVQIVHSMLELQQYIEDENENFVSNEIGCKFVNYCITYMNNKYGYTTKTYSQSAYNALNGAVWGCKTATTTGNYIEVEESPAEYQTVTKQVGTCQHCNKEWIKD